MNPISGGNWSTVGNAVDADNVNYSDTTTNANGATNSLLDYHFVGSPVVDGQGNVYVAAQNGNSGFAAVLCFSADQEVTAEAEVPNGSPPPLLTRVLGFDTTQARYFQIDESTGNPQNPLVAIPNPGRGAGRYGQITTAGPLASVFNFGRGSGGSRQIAGNLCEPQPFTATPSGPNGGQAAWMYFHTNLEWYATFSVNGQISGVSKSGSTLLLCDTGAGGSNSYNVLYKLPAAPTVGVGKLAALTVRKAPLGTGAGGTYLNVGTVTAAPSAGGGAMVINGGQGVAAFNQQLTLIADNNRILEVDADGNAVWSADATTRISGSGREQRDHEGGLRPPVRPGPVRPERLPRRRHGQQPVRPLRPWRRRHLGADALLRPQRPHGPWAALHPEPASQRRGPRRVFHIQGPPAPYRTPAISRRLPASSYITWSPTRATTASWKSRTPLTRPGTSCTST